MQSPPSSPTAVARCLSAQRIVDASGNACAGVPTGNGNVGALDGLDAISCGVNPTCQSGLARINACESDLSCASLSDGAGGFAQDDPFFVGSDSDVFFNSSGISGSSAGPFKTNGDVSREFSSSADESGFISAFGSANNTSSSDESGFIDAFGSADNTSSADESGFINAFGSADNTSSADESGFVDAFGSADNTSSADESGFVNAFGNDSPTSPAGSSSADEAGFVDAFGSDSQTSSGSSSFDEGGFSSLGEDSSNGEVLSI
jgi:hypothetical protein